MKLKTVAEVRKYAHCRISSIGGSGGGGAVLWTRTSSPVEFISFSCNFQQQCCQIIGFCPKYRGWRPPPPPRLGIPGSATELSLFSNYVLIEAFKTAFHVSACDGCSTFFKCFTLYEACTHTSIYLFWRLTC